MKINLTLKTLGTALGVAVLLGMLIGSALTWKCGKSREVKVEVVNPLIALQFDQMLDTQIKLRKNLQDMYKTWKFTTAKGETVYVDSTTPWADVPVIQADFDTAFTIKIDDRPLSIGVHGELTVKGQPISLILRPHKTTYSVAIPVKQPFVDLYATVAGGVNYSLHPVAEAEVGITFWQKAVLFGRLNSTLHDGAMEWQTMAGAKWVLF